MKTLLRNIAVSCVVVLTTTGLVVSPASANPTAGTPDSGGQRSPLQTDQEASVVSEPGADLPLPSAEPTRDASAVPESERDEVLGESWNEGTDLAWQLAGDVSGLHILTAEKRTGFEWAEKATLAAGGFETDRWVGNACLARGTTKLAVTYAPRAFTNESALFLHGAFAAIVDLESGEVDDLGNGFSLAYFSPSCGVDGWVTYSRYSETGKARFESYKADDPSQIKSVDTDSSLTSPVETGAGLVAAGGSGIVTVDASGQTSVLQSTEGVASELTPVDDGIAFLQREADGTSVKWLDTTSDAPKLSELANATQGEVGLVSDGSGVAHLVGQDVDASLLPEGLVSSPDVPVGASLSKEGEFATESALIPDTASGQPEPVAQIKSRVVGGPEVTFSVPVSEGLRVETVVPEEEGAEAQRRAASFPDVPQDAWTSGSTCAVPRNWAKNQALQPRPVQAQWAANQAVRGLLTETRPANWMNLDLPSYSPQGLFPRTGITTPAGGRVPTQILLGILAQESNLRQASPYTVPGVTGNPLVGNYYGTDRGSSAADAWWQIDYSGVDCGFGIGQVTDQMRYNEMDNWKQRVIALDYEANIARSLQILESKWNETRAHGLIINDGNPAYLENWFFALWAYNTGFNHPLPGSTANTPWGVGWLNNPANPIYDPNRTPFLDGRPSDGAHPQDWPYPEKVLGFAAHSVQLLDSVSSQPLKDVFNYQAAFAPAWWPGADDADGAKNRRDVKPPWDLFCKPSNKCFPDTYLNGPDGTQDPGPCNSWGADGKPDYKCWYHDAATWKTDCPSKCGYETVLSTSTPKPANANSFPANCSASGLPAGALIVDNLPAGTPAVRPGCSAVPTVGSFQFLFPDIGTGNFPAKVDLHQLGSGFNGQFYFTHTRVPGTAPAFDGELKVTGKWSLGQSLNGWAQVYVHMPNHGAWLQQANYKINTGSKTVTRSVGQRTYANSWVPLGALEFAGSPSIELDNAPNSLDPLSGVDDVAWDAVAFVPLAAKPSQFVVALGDSYSSGEGTSAPDGSGFFRSSDHNGQSQWHNNGCHRSTEAWPFKIDLPDVPGAETIKQLTQANDSRLDFQFLACSGAETHHVDGLDLPNDPEIPGGAGGRFDELPQLDRGFLDSNTTLVTMSIGGNDLGFSPILEHCLFNRLSPFSDPCDQTSPPEGFSGATMREAVGARLDALAARVEKTLAAIKNRAPNAKILMLGYPTLFETSGLCIFMPHRDRPWLNEMAKGLNAQLTKAAANAGTHVIFADPQYRFRGHNLCTDQPGITGLMLDLTPGDRPMVYVPLPQSPDKPVGLSSQSVHPNSFGTGLYAQVANAALRSERVALTAGVTGGAPTTYYSTFRWHDGGPAALNVSSFSSCGQEIRIGMRRSPNGTQQNVGQQHTETLSWTKAHDLQNFYSSDTSSTTPDLLAGFYAMNARLTTACAAGSNQSWTGSLYW